MTTVMPRAKGDINRYHIERELTLKKTEEIVAHYEDIISARKILDSNIYIPLALGGRTRLREEYISSNKKLKKLLKDKELRRDDLEYILERKYKEHKKEILIEYDFIKNHQLM